MDAGFFRIGVVVGRQRGHGHMDARNPGIQHMDPRLMPIVPFAEYAPDNPELGNPGTQVALNVIPAARGYIPFKKFSITTSGLTARCQGAKGFRSSNGTVFTFAGDATKLYKRNGQTWTDVSGSAYTCPSDGYWGFVAFGDLVIATNGSNAPQKFDMSSASVFSALGGSPPTAKYIAIVKEQVVMANVTGFPQRVQWSGIDNAETWAVSQTTQADYQDLVGDHGDITGIVGGDVGYVFFERAVFRMDYVNVPGIFQFTRVEQARGCAASASLVPQGRIVYYLAQDGFYAFDGQQSIPIGANKVDRTFLDDLAPDYAFRVIGGIDPEKKIVIWGYPNGSSTLGNPNAQIIYNWSTQRWAAGSQNLLQWLFTDLVPNTTLEDLDNIDASIENIPGSLDDRTYAGGNFVLAAFGSRTTPTVVSNAYGTFNGSPAPFSLTTSEAQIFQGRRALVTKVWPVFHGSSVDIDARVLYRDRANDAQTTSSRVAQNAVGFCPFRIDARYHSINVLPTAIISGADYPEWEHAIGVEVEAVPTGMR